MGHKPLQIWIAGKPHLLRDSSVLGGIKAAMRVANDGVQASKKVQCTFPAIWKIQRKGCAFHWK